MNAQPDHRHNAPPTIASKHGNARADALYRRAEARRQHYMATYAPKPVAPTRQRDSWAVRYQYVLTGIIVFGLVFWAAAR